MNIWSRKIKLWLKSSSEISGGFPGSIRPNPAWGSLRCLSRRRICRSSRISGRPLRTPDVYLTTMVYSFFFQHKIMYHVLFCIYVWYDMCTDLTIICTVTVQHSLYNIYPHHIICVSYICTLAQWRRYVSDTRLFLPYEATYSQWKSPTLSLLPCASNPLICRLLLVLRLQLWQIKFKWQ